MKPFCQYFIVAALSFYSFHAISEPQKEAVIRVSASGEVKAMPDYINISVSIEKSRKTKAEAKSEVDAITKKVIDALNKLGIEKKHIEASNIMARPDYEWSNNKQTIKGEIVSRTVNIELHALDNYSTLAQTLLTIDITRLDQNGAGFNNIETYQNQALVLALKKAEIQAQVIANTMNTPLIGIAEISTSLNDAPMPIYNAKLARAPMAVSMAADNSAEAPLDITPQSISSSVNISYWIKN